MAKMDRETIEKIGEGIFAESDIIANHGTSIANAKSIIETGFRFYGTSMAIHKTKNVSALCTYGWKENKGGDAANVVLSVPKAFFMDLLGYDENEYSKWIEKIKKEDSEVAVINSVCDFTMGGYRAFTFEMPKEFVRGVFVYTDNKTYLNFLNNIDEGMNYLEYIDNPKFYNNLSEEEKSTFVEEMRNKMFGNKNKKTQTV